ncbi:MAG TPA: putative peptidoglycan glycosyltransferase FtsW [Gemmatimonadales bacterium]|nr:putative peptidoglycan glycosyltransferase FtsW [Gemmatimonadales bacterium]
MTAPARPAPGGWETRLLAIVTATLVVFGIAAVYGASSLVAVQRGEPGSWFAIRQLVGAAAGGVVFLVAARLDYHLWQRLAWPLLGLTAAALAVPFLPAVRALAPEVNGARRWIDVGVVSVQPSEIAKFAVVVWTAMLATKKGERVRGFRYGLAPFLVIVGPMCALVLFQPDLSTAVDIALLAGLVLFVAGARIGHFLLLGLVAVPLLWREIVTVQYRLSRILTFLSPGGDAQEASWQITQSLIGIGAGQVVGVGFGQGMQKLGYLPYAYSDFIFSTIGEEWGFVGVCLVVLLFALFLWMGFRIARMAPDMFGMLLAVGLTGLIGTAAIVHMAVTLALVPTTGLPLPFISYGRSSLVVSLLAAGVLVSIGSAAGRPRRESRPRPNP